MYRRPRVSVSNYVADLADAPECTPVPCLAVPCKTASSGWTLVAIALVGLALNASKLVRGWDR